MIEDILMSRGIYLSVLPSAGSYVPAIRTGNLIYVSGQIPFENGSMLLPAKFVGKVPTHVRLETAKQAARQCTINALANLKELVGDLENISKFVRVCGYVNCEPTFTEQSKIIDGASDFLIDIFGDKGSHTRVSIGSSSLPLGSVVEIDFICQIK
jgi:enamine deaminase RidA (YjgF/YER057c/UK114 family)